MSPSTFGHYQILDKIGAGGMGVVYRAHDTQLGRDVACKVLPAEFVGDAESRTRLRREAHALAALNHPNIASIYGFEESDSRGVLVMELVAGLTLAERIARGALPVKETLTIARQIAEALECAHERGIIHRDLKPGNIKLKEDSVVKVLDFGLAKILEPAKSDNNETSTISDLTSKPGTVLGTVAYMSPEQARGSPADRRTDVWAFGVVLYEMLTGRRAFEGVSSSEVMAAVMKDDPDWTTLPSETPAAIRKLLHRCLVKDPRNRLHSIADARLEIEEVLAAAPGTGNGSSAAGKPAFAGLRTPLTWVLLALVVLLAVLLFWKRPGRQATARISARYSIILPDDAPLAPASVMPLSVGRPLLALSPDGSRLVYVALASGETKLYLHEMERGEFRPLPGTEGAHSPFFSPDGEWVGFFAHDKLQKVGLTGDPPTVLCGATLGFGGSWAADGTIYFSTDYSSEIYRVAASGGRPEVVTGEGPQVQAQFFPQILADNRAILFSTQRGMLGVHDLQAGRRKLLRLGTFPHFSPTGHLLFSSSGTIQAAHFDLKRLEIIGSPVLLVDGVRSERDGGSQFTLSSDGTLVFAAGLDGTVGSLMWLDSSGKKHPLGAPAGDYDAFRLSPDGKKIAIPIRTVDGIDIWVYDIGRGTTNRLTFDHKSSFPVWSPDGSVVYYSCAKNGIFNIWQIAADGSGGMRQIHDSKDAEWPSSISPDGKWLLVSKRGADTREDLWLLPLSPGDSHGKEAGEEIPYLQSPFNETLASISPDSHWAAYTSDESGGSEVYVRSFPRPGEKIRISAVGGEEPVWSRDGHELYYRFGTKWFMVKVTLGDRFGASRPRLLFEGSYANIPGYSYEIAPDGKFLLVEGAEQTKTVPRLSVITNIFDEIQRRVPSHQ